jgi:TrmH family RNA methyltransferase
MPSLVTLPPGKAKLIRDLLRHKLVRDRERTFVLEGEKPIRELLMADSPSLLAIVVKETRLSTIDDSLRLVLERGPVTFYTCRASVFSKLSDVSTPSGLLAIVQQPTWNQDQVFKRPRILGLYGESIQDPANVGAIIRTALGLGLDAIWLSADSADVFNPKVVRATAGAILRLPVFSINEAGFFTRRRCTLLAAVPPGQLSRTIQEIKNIPPRAVLAFGNESRGLSLATLKQAALRFSIPVSPAVDSLNVAASAAIASFYFSGLPKEP